MLEVSCNLAKSWASTEISLLINLENKPSVLASALANSSDNLPADWVALSNALASANWDFTVLKSNSCSAPVASLV